MFTNIALIGYGNVGRALVQLISSQKEQYPFRITGIHTARHGTAIDNAGLPPVPKFGPAAPNCAAFLDAVDCQAVVELTPLNPQTGEPAISHILEAFGRGYHVVTANKGPIAHGYRRLNNDSRKRGLQFRFESTVMDGAPVFGLVRKNLPGVQVLGFAGVLNSTSKIVIAALREGKTKAEGIMHAQRLGIAEANPEFDLAGWDSAVKAAALANVLLAADVVPQAVERSGIEEFTSAQVRQLANQGKTVCLVSRGQLWDGVPKLRAAPEILNDNDLLASVQGTSNLLLLDTDLMGTLGIVSMNPGVEQTAYGVFSDLIDIFYP